MKYLSERAWRLMGRSFIVDFLEQRLDDLEESDGFFMDEREHLQTMLDEV